MTIRRKQPKHDGEIEVVEQEIKNPWLRLLLGQNGWKLIILILILTQHPLGRGVLSTLGFEFPDTKKISVAAETASQTKSDLTQIADSVKEIQKDVTSLKANNAILNAKVDTLDQTFRGFQIDFSKWKPADKKNEP